MASGWHSKGVSITCNLFWTNHIGIKKAYKHLYLLGKLRKFGMYPKMITNFYRCAVENILTGCITTWFGNNSTKTAINCTELWMLPNPSHKLDSQPTTPSTVHFTISLESSQQWHLQPRSVLLYPTLVKEKLKNVHHRLRNSFFLTVIRVVNGTSIN